MALPSLFLVLAPSILLTWVVYSFVTAYLRLRNFPGPKLAAWTDVYFVWLSTTGRQHVILGELVDQYGQLTRIGPNMLLTDDEEFVRKMNSVRSTYSKSAWYKAFKLDGNHDNILSQLDRDRHLELRNKISSGYAGTNNPTFESDIDSIIRKVVQQVDAKYISRGADVKPLDYSDMMMFMTLDITTLLAMGKEIGFVDADQDLFEYVATMWNNFPVVNFLTSYPPLVSFLSIPFIQRNTAPSVKESTGLGKIKAVAFENVRERLAQRQSGKETRQDMMESFIKSGLNESQLADNMLVALLAGSETTATVLKALMTLIISNIRVYKKLQAACDEVLDEVPLSQIISYSRAQQIPYLDACVKEAQRYHPSGTGPLPRVVPKEGDWYDGKFIPGGTIIAHARWNMSRKNSKVYGKDCDVFRPERWLEASGEQLAQMERSNDSLFNTGKHRCLGERTAKMDLYKVTFEMARRYDISSLTPSQPMKESYNYGLWMQRGMLLRVEKRDVISEKTYS